MANFTQPVTLYFCLHVNFVFDRTHIKRDHLTPFPSSLLLSLQFSSFINISFSTSWVPLLLPHILHTLQEALVLCQLNETQQQSQCVSNLFYSFPFSSYHKLLFFFVVSQFVWNDVFSPRKCSSFHIQLVTSLVDTASVQLSVLMIHPLPQVTISHLCSVTGTYVSC